MGWYQEWHKQRQAKKIRRYERAVNQLVQCAGRVYPEEPHAHVIEISSRRGGKTLRMKQYLEGMPCPNKVRPKDAWVSDGKLYCDECEKRMPDTKLRKRFENALASTDQDQG